MTETPLQKTALIYDFDGTLAEGNLPEHALLGWIGEDDVAAFWQRTNGWAQANDGDGILSYMRGLVESGRKAKEPITRDLLNRAGKDVPFFPGVDGWFDRINEYGASKGLEIEHYVVSSGILEIIEGTKHFSRFKKVFACSYAYNDEGEAVWPKSAIDYTQKTQFLFRINKGVHAIGDDKNVNQYMSLEDRPVPFERMIFVGDGDTDIPSFKMVRFQGGHAVAVFGQSKWDESKTKRKLEALLAADRVNHIAPADYSPGSLLDTTIRGLLGRMSERPPGPGKK